MKKKKLLFALIIGFSSANIAQTINCGSFCVLSIGNVDTLTNELDVTIYNGDTNSVNYPSVVVVNGIGDTIANKNNLFFLFQHPANDTVVHTIPCDTTLDSIPSGFTGTIYITDNFYNITCAYSYPMTCTVGINEYASSNNFTLYPNPTSDNITISMTGNNRRNADIRIYDMTGKEVKNYTTTNSLLTINRENLQSGIYFVTITLNDKRFTQKLIIK